MRIIIKPMGAVVCLIALLMLSTLALRNTPLNIFKTLFAPKLNSVSILSPLEKWNMTGGDNVGTALTVATIDGQSFKQALHAKVNAVVPDPWKVQISNSAIAPIQTDDVLLASFYGRVLNGVGKVNFVCEQNSEPFDKSVSEDVLLTKSWKRYQIPFRARQSLRADQIGINFQLGFGKQTVEIADIRLMNYKKTITYRELNAQLTETR